MALLVVRGAVVAVTILFPNREVVAVLMTILPSLFEGSGRIWGNIWDLSGSWSMDPEGFGRI